jgi:replicative superfamily II helicase
MDKKAIGHQLEIEAGLIKHIVESLRETLDWKVEDTGAARKLSTLRFVAQAFHRHLERLMVIHEHDGYMAHLIKLQPHLVPAVDKLKAEQDCLRDELNFIDSHLDRANPTDERSVEDVAKRLREVLEVYQAHSEREQELLLEAFLRDDGGGN